MWLQHGSDVLSCLDIEVHINLQWPSRNQGWHLDQISALSSSLDQEICQVFFDIFHIMSHKQTQALVEKMEI